MRQAILLGLLFVVFRASAAIMIPPLVGEPGRLRRIPAHGRRKSGEAAMTAAFHKYGWTPPTIDPLAMDTGETLSIQIEDPTTTDQNKGISSTQVPKAGKVDADPAKNNTEYVCPVVIGTQTFNMMIDTGSSDLWVLTTALNQQQRGSHVVYDPSRSSSHRSIDQAVFKVSYGDGTSLAGKVAADKVAIGGVTVSAQAISLPTAATSSILGDPADGIVGLGFQKLNSICNQDVKETPSSPSGSCPNGFSPSPQPTWFENARASLNAGVFTASLRAGRPGYYEFGTIDRSAFVGDLRYAPINSSQGYWQFSSQSYRVGSKDNEPIRHSGADGIADTGTTLLLLLPEIVEDYYKNVQGSKYDHTGYSFPCDAVLPDLTIDIGGVFAVLPGQLMNYAPNSDPKFCYGGVQSNNGQGLQIFGDIMFQALFVVFDYDNLRLGLATPS